MYPGTHSATRPDHPAVIMAGSGNIMTYLELERESARLARHLHDQGLRPGDGLATICGNEPQFFITYWAAIRSGLYYTPLNTHLAPHEAVAVLANCAPRAIVVSAGQADLAAAVLPDLSTVEVALAVGGPVAGCQDYDAALAATSTEPMAVQPRGQDMLYSSGTTGGTPKGIRPPLPERLVHERGDALIETFGPRFAFDENAVYLSPAPLYHGGPLRYAMLVQALGGTVVVLEKFDAEAALAAIDTYRCTHSQWVPTMFVRMLKLDESVRRRHDVSSMQWAIHASAPCPVEVKRAMIQWWGPVLHEYYASQESAGITIISCEEWLAHPGSVGRAHLGEVKICDAVSGEVVMEPGRTGKVYFARDELPFTYHRDEASTRLAQHPTHPTWTSPGDIGYVDEEGYLYLTDRQSFMIISGGVNVFPQEIENELTLHEAVDDVAVVGSPDPDLGEVVVAVVKPAPGHEPGPELEQRLLDALSGRLARYKIPRRVDFVEALPRTPTGKLAKTELIRRYRETTAGV